MARRKRAREKGRGDVGVEAANEAFPEPPVNDAPEPRVPAPDFRPGTAGASGVIFTAEGMIEEEGWRDPRMRERPPEEKSLQELVASVLAGPLGGDQTEHDGALGLEEPAEVERANAPVDDPAETPDPEEVARRRLRVVALLGAAAFIVAAGAFLFITGGGGSDAGPDSGVAHSGEVPAAPPEGGAAPPADSQVAAQPPPAPVPVVAPVETPVPPPAPVVTVAPAPAPPPPTAAPTPPPPPPTEIHVGDLDAGTPGQKVAVKIYVHDAAHNPVSGVTVTGQWGGAYSDTASCVTDATGSCGVRTQNLSTAGGVTFTVTTLSLAGTVYAGAANHDPDGDSSGTSITIGA